MLRLSSLDAIEMDDAAVRAGDAERARIAPYLHLSLQHGDDLILKRMKRRHSRAQAIELCQRLKAARPEIALGADLIAGFPTETDAAFANTLSLIDECGLAFVHAFPFSPREGTPAARMPQVDRRVVKARAARLREAGAAALERHLDALGRARGRRAGRARWLRASARFHEVTISPSPRGEGVGGRVIPRRSTRRDVRGSNAPHNEDPTPCPSLKGRGMRLRFTAHDGAHLIGVAA